MTQHHETDSRPAPARQQPKSLAGASSASDSLARAANASERSRFSQWLASFGLGEMPLPLLSRRRARAVAEESKIALSKTSPR